MLDKLIKPTYIWNIVFIVCKDIISDPEANKKVFFTRLHEASQKAGISVQTNGNKPET